MTDGIRQGFGLLVLFAATMGCAAQSQQNAAPRVADAHPDERGYRECHGSVCGPKSQMTTWVFESAPIPEDKRDAYVENHCFGAVCGPLATTSPTWTLETSSQDCLASVCGREAIAATTIFPYRQTAQVRSASCTNSNQ